MSDVHRYVTNHERLYAPRFYLHAVYQKEDVCVQNQSHYLTFLGPGFMTLSLIKAFVYKLTQLTDVV